MSLKGPHQVCDKADNPKCESKNIHQPINYETGTETGVGPEDCQPSH